jgi:hypothetical protein
MPRGTVIAIGCWLWATMTALFALTTSLYVAMPICAMNGMGEQAARSSSAFELLGGRRRGCRDSRMGRC